MSRPAPRLGRPYGASRVPFRATASLILLASLVSPACAPAAQLRLELAADGLERPVDFVAAPGDSRLFIVEQWGRIRVLENGRVRPEPFLDLSDQVSRGNEQGLLGLAFHPRFASNGLLFVNYTDRNGDTHVTRYRVTRDRRFADPATATTILFVQQPYANHNGGQVLFGPDSMLYIPLGDGGSGGDPHGNGQNLKVLLGKLLRIDVNRGTPYAIPPDNPFARSGKGRPEIWAYGLRNPWRIAFDSGLLYIADVGQNQWEEVDVAPAREAGINYGWNRFEGNHVFPARIGARPRLDAHAPALEYSHGQGCCIIGGHVYRGSVAALRGQYFYADECGGWIESFRWRNGRAEERTRWRFGPRIHPSAFGVDARGELFVLDLDGRVFRIAGAQ
jgi:glucose/arabinose dehydrogenase